ncbi:MAG: fatty acid desaturase [Acidimicrobiia bacterium]|nr:fatty acid desaturase [Acidimicrobiia bacterium]
MTSTTQPEARRPAPASQPEGAAEGELVLGMTREKDWVNISVIGAAHLLALAGVAWLVFVAASPWTVALGLVWFALCGMGITGGYHRLFAHKSYRASWPVRLFYLCFGAAAVQNSALKWSSDHRVHHAFTDRDGDPYNIRRGFFWAHMGWILFKDPNVQRDNVRDLAADPLVRFQDRFYIPLAILFGAVLPWCLGWIWGDPWGALLVAGFLRLVLEWHATFFVNSLAHTLGSQPYCRVGSARDSFITAIVTLGEGYHNFHHRFQADYRNGVRWYQLDPTKWLVWSLSKVGLTSELRRTPPQAIERAKRETAEAARRERAAA